MKPTLIMLAAAAFFWTSCATKRDVDERARPYVERSKTYAMAAFTAMSGRLHHAIADSGIPYALRYCSAQAYPMLDSIARAHGVHMRRATIWTRNPADEATPDEQNAILAFRQNMESKKPMEPIVSNVDEPPVHVYLPIQIAMPVCLQCHGKVGKDVSQEDYQLIRSLYPQDNATGHSMGDLRGVWHFTFDNPLH